MTPRHADRLALGALVLGAVCIGFAPIWVRWSEVGSAATAFYRLALALPVLAVWAARERRPPGPGAPAWSWGWAVSAGVCFALDLAAWHASIRLTTVANATLLANLAPLVVTLGAWIVLRERPGRRFLLGTVVGLAGAWRLTGASFTGDPARWQGDLLGLTTALFYGSYQLCIARLRRTHGPARVLWWSSLLSTPVLGLIAVGLGEPLVPASGRGWAAVIGLALTAQVLGQGLITYGFSRLTAGFSSLTLLVQPLVAALAAWLVFGERLDRGQILGGILLLAGLHLARGPGLPAAVARTGAGGLVPATEPRGEGGGGQGRAP